MEMFCYSEPRKNLKETTLFLVFHLLSFLVVNCSQILQENSVAIRKWNCFDLKSSQQFPSGLLAR